MLQAELWSLQAQQRSLWLEVEEQRVICVNGGESGWLLCCFFGVLLAFLVWLESLRYVSSRTVSVASTAALWMEFWRVMLNAIPVL